MSGLDHTAILDRVLEPVTECLTPDVAAKLVTLRADAQTQDLRKNCRKRVDAARKAKRKDAKAQRRQEERARVVAQRSPFSPTGSAASRKQ